MLKYLCIILLFIVHICYSNYYDDNINWSNCEYVKSLSASPFYVEGLPDIIKSTSIQLESLKIIVGSFSFNLCIAPSRENYYQILIKAVSMGLNENIQETSNFINDIISITDKIPEVLKNSSINDVEKWLRSQQMKAVRNGNGEEAKLYYSLYKKASIAKKYNSQISKIIESSQTIKESLMLLATCSSPIQYYDGVDNALYPATNKLNSF